MTRCVVRQGIDRLQAGSLAPVVCLAIGIASTGPVMSCCSPRNVIVAQMERVPFAAHCERLPFGREYGSVPSLRLGSGMTLRDLIEREGEGS